ncbi:MAG: HAMP domain-containing protein, partial [Spirochaetales bacterium]|nr:HAMP domain-containing protein [Spirochaetales bacterium]
MSLLFLFILLIALTLFLSQQVLSDIARGVSVFDTAFVPMVAILPLTLLGAVAYQGIRLWRQRRENRPGSRLKLRLSLFFSLASILASVPQGLLSVGFIDTTMRSWLGPAFGQALENGLNTALEFHQSRVEGLKTTANSPFLPEIVRRTLAQPTPHNLSQILEEYGLRPSAFEIYTSRGKLVVRTGVSPAFWDASSPIPAQDGPLPKETRAGSTILRQLRHVSVGNKTYTVFLSAVLPPAFDTATDNLTRALATYHRLTHYEHTFRTLVLFFYLMFAAPILLIALLIGFTLGDDLIRPLINLENATRRVAEGDFAVRILTPEHDELAFLATSFNSMTAELALSRTKLQQTEKITAWQEIARQLAHEIRNPLTPIRLSAERIRRRRET